VLGGKNTSLINLKLRYGCVGQLSINSTFLFFFRRNSFHKFRVFSKITGHPNFGIISMHYWIGCYTLKHQGLFDFPITSSFLLLVPVMLVAIKTVILSLNNFPPEHFAPLKRRVLTGVSFNNGLLHYRYKCHHHSNRFVSMAKR